MSSYSDTLISFGSLKDWKLLSIQGQSIKLLKRYIARIFPSINGVLRHNSIGYAVSIPNEIYANTRMISEDFRFSEGKLNESNVIS